MARAARRRKKEEPMQVEVEYIDLHELTPYDKNPRVNSTAIEYVANSIREYGFYNPIIIDEDNVIVAGHTRRLAAISLVEQGFNQFAELPCLRTSNLSEAQIRAFRIADNKTGEQAQWDISLLGEEMEFLRSVGVDMVPMGFTQEEIDCLSDAVQDDCLSATGFMDEQDRDRAGRAEPRAPSQARMVLSEFVFFLPMDVYRRWANEVRATNNYDEDAIVEDLQRRLGMTHYLESAD